MDAAVPLVVVPFGADQHENAATVQRLGIGVVIAAEALSPRAVRTAVDSLSEPGAPYRARLETLRDEWRALPEPADAVQALVELVEA